MLLMPSHEPSALPVVDASTDSHYSRYVAPNRIKVGEMWKQDSSGDSYLITKVYNEALATYAVLRKAGSENDPPLKVKVDRQAATGALPGFTHAQQTDDF
jgi:hypothetical protein